MENSTFHAGRWSLHGRGQFSAKHLLASFLAAMGANLTELEEALDHMQEELDAVHLDIESMWLVLGAMFAVCERFVVRPFHEKLLETHSFVLVDGTP